MSHVKDLAARKVIEPPRFVVDGLQYEAIMGSYAFGASDSLSDRDIMAFTIPTKSLIWPHLQGVIPGFDTQVQGFDQFEKHHVIDEDGSEYDLNVYSIVKFFALAVDGNPTLLDALFAPLECCTYVSGIARQVRDARRSFLHKGCWKRYRGYAGAMLHKVNVKRPAEGSRRAEIVKEHGFDTKYAAHAVRLVLEGLQILREGDLDVRANGAVMREIRAGQWTEVQVKRFVEEREKEGEALYISESSPVPYKRDEPAVKALLVRCLEEHFGTLAGAWEDPSAESSALDRIATILREVNR